MGSGTWRTGIGLAGLVLVGLWPTRGAAQTVPPEEFGARRERLMERLGDGLILLHARSGPKDMEQPGWVQDASFLYFTGLTNQPGAVLTLDASRGEVRLFVPPPPMSFGVPVADLGVAVDEESARTLGVQAVERWEGLVPYLRQRVAEGVTRFWVDEARRRELPGTPDGLWPVAGEKDLWRRSLAAAFPGVAVESAGPVITALRWIKSPGEVAILGHNARMTARALLAGVGRIEPGVTQRITESAVVAGCLAAGAQGPSFWPWTMSGPNAHVRRLVRAFFDYHHLDRTMQAGELVRVDVGCTAGGYGGDVGRTVPVSGRFLKGQREAWDLLIGAYRAGMAVMRDGVALVEVLAASRAEVMRRQPGLTTALGRAAGTTLAGEGGMALWTIHGVGIDSGESPRDTLRAGSVIAFEPMFEEGADAFYLEDMILITPTGFEVLSAGLPYTAAEIEEAMARAR